ncbi:acyltransferase family protein [Corynebacterium sp. ES2775-CONJ]|uniref:acyltransferase family protein n=1 Tax=Corynebacterium sp. ES2775-CONJ TaxID=2974029 RepID=UPI002167E7A7|nr:acyltransferase family protein [Corynebacterium sp. ES2775-CONJ]MCS4489117.1 acetyltransferase [Corynebacterium sp. ES2775-CONJ]
MLAGPLNRKGSGSNRRVTRFITAVTRRVIRAVPWLAALVRYLMLSLLLALLRLLTGHTITTVRKPVRPDFAADLEAAIAKGSRGRIGEENLKKTPEPPAPHPVAKRVGDRNHLAASSQQHDDSKKTVTYRIRRVPGIDGLRGIAVMAVVFYHFFRSAMPGGFMGVDMFFVLSGFLITSLLVREYSVLGRIDLKKFWIRRARRILPAAFIVLIITTALAGLVGGDPSVKLGEQFAGTLIFANNWTQIAASASYFADSGVQILAHYWSLAVEEQFYLIWPLIFVALMRMFKKIGCAILATVLVLGTASFAAMLALYDPAADPTRVYYGTDTHSFGLLMGVFLALIMTSTSADPHADSWPRNRNLLAGLPGVVVGVLSMIGLTTLFFVVSDTAAFTYRGGLVLASLFTVLILAQVSSEVGILSRVMGTSVLRWLGERSFSLYLWHWPIVVLLQELNHQQMWAQHSEVIGLLALITSLVISHLSYVFVETPVRRRGYRHLWRSSDPRVRAVVAGTLITLLAAAALAIVRSPQQTELQSQLERLAHNQTAPREITAIPAAEATDVATPLYGPQLPPTGDRMTAVGDSVMLGSVPALEKNFPGMYIDAEVSRSLVAAPSILQSLADAGRLDPFVVLGFGTNGALSEEALKQVMDIIGQQRVVIMVMPYGERTWIPISQERIARAQDTYENLYIAPWCQLAQANPDKLYSDRIHPNEQGRELYSQAISDALSQWANHRKNPTTGCGV